MKLRLVLVFAILLVGCKKKDAASVDYSSKEDVQKVEKDNIFKIQLNVKTSKKDLLEVYYVDDNPEGKFESGKKVRQKTSGMDAFQDVEFSLPAEVFPYKFRIDLGDNKAQDNIEIDHINIKYNSNSFKIGKDSIQYFFAANEYIDWDKTNSVFSFKEVNGRQDPFLVAKALLIKKLEIEL